MTDSKKKGRKLAEKCIVPACGNYTGMPGGKIFFRAPSIGSKVYKKWSSFVHLSGNRTEMICDEHFRQTDFVEYSRLKLRNLAVPSANLPPCDPKVKVGKVCCVTGCPTRAHGSLKPFPVINSVLKRWKTVLGMAESSSTAGFMICHRHFVKKDYQKVRSTYLKPNSVPSKKIAPLIRIPKRRFLAGERPKHLQDHNYNRFEDHSRSNRICYAAGCRSRVTEKITLHKFPPRSDSRFSVWVESLKCKTMPTKNSKLCSLHFDKTCYVPGGKHQKKDAIPTLRLPYVTDHINDYPSSSSMESFYDPEPVFPEAKPEASDKTKDVANETMVTSSLMKDETNSSASLTDIKDTQDESENINVDHINAPMYNVEFENSLDFGDISGINQTTDEPNKLSVLSEVKSNANESCMDSMNAPRLNSTPYSALNDTHGAACNQKRKSKLESSTAHDQTTDDRTACSKCILSDLLLTDKEVNTWTGLPSLTVLEEICLAVRRLESVGEQRKFSMHTTDRVILTLAKIKQNISFEALGSLFRITGVTASKYFSHMVPVLASILRQFIHWPTKEEVKENVPMCFREHFSNVTVVLDCTEVPVASLKCLNCRIACYSNYKCRRTVKFLVGVTPAGLISFVSKAYSGKASDKFIFNGEGLIDRLEPHVDEVMVDKGVSIETECSSKCIKLHMPPFMRGERLSPLEATRNEAIARARIHVERVIQRIKLFAFLRETITTNLLALIDDIMDIICGIVNLSPPILKDDKF